MFETVFNVLIQMRYTGKFTSKLHFLIIGTMLFRKSYLSFNEIIVKYCQNVTVPIVLKIFHEINPRLIHTDVRS